MRRHEGLNPHPCAAGALDRVHTSLGIYDSEAIVLLRVNGYCFD